MTTRARRSKPQQVRDILLSWLKEQDAKAEKLHLAWEDAIEGADRTRRMIELLDQAMLPGMEPEPPIEPEGMLTLPPGGPIVPKPKPTLTTIVGSAVMPMPYPTLTDVVVAEAHLVAPLGAVLTEQMVRDALVMKTEPSPEPAPRPRRQRIGGKKAPAISDVWNPKSGVVSVHTALMYERQELCSLCREGVPFATEERTGHHVIISYADGVERGFEYRLCNGVKETA